MSEEKRKRTPRMKPEITLGQPAQQEGEEAVSGTEPEFITPDKLGTTVVRRVGYSLAYQVGGSPQEHEAAREHVVELLARLLRNATRPE